MIGQELSQCYDDVNMCLWTDGSQLNQSAAQTACQQRDNSFLPRVTSSNIQDTLRLFRAAVKSNNETSTLLDMNGFWIDLDASHPNFRWIDGSAFAGLSAFLYMLLLTVLNFTSLFHALTRQMPWVRPAFFMDVDVLYIHISSDIADPC